MNEPWIPSARRTAFAIVGCCSAALGIAGVFIPGLPTTVFVLIASYFFARSSPRFNQWLHRNRWLGPKLKNLEAGGMTRSQKRAALISMWIAVTVSCAALSRVHAGFAAGTAALGAIGTVCIVFAVATVPEPPPDTADSPSGPSS